LRSLALSNSDNASTPAIGGDGTIYFIAGGQLHAVSPSGSERWAFQGQQSQWAGLVGPVIGQDGTLYAGSDRTHWFYAINPDGTQKWATNVLADTCFGAPALGPGDTLYVPAFGLYAITSAGTPVWTNLSAGNASPVVGADGAIYVGNSSLALTAISQNGGTNWQVAPYSVPARPTTAAIDSSGTIFYCVSNAVFAVTPQGVVQWVFESDYPPDQSAGEVITSPIIGPGGAIYTAVYQTLYAIANTNGPAHSLWPMFNQNARHTGKIERPSLNHPQKRSDGGFQFQLQGELGQGYTVLGSTNLNTWTSLTSLVVTSVPMDMTDFTATNFPVRFYRALSP
jgi:outer membrane protein assembly factor BamB